MSLKSSPDERLSIECRKCHSNALMRKIHLLRMIDQGKDSRDIYAHLLSEFGKKQEDDGFIKAEMVSLDFIRSNYGKPANIPAWMNWLENKAWISRTPRGWRIIPRDNDWKSVDYDKLIETRRLEVGQ